MDVELAARNGQAFDFPVGSMFPGLFVLAVFFNLKEQVVEGYVEVAFAVGQPLNWRSTRFLLNKVARGPSYLGYLPGIANQVQLPVFVAMRSAIMEEAIHGTIAGEGRIVEVASRGPNVHLDRPNLVQLQVVLF